MVLGERCRWIHSRTPAPIEAARTPLVTMAATAPIQTIKGTPNFADRVAAVTWPTSPHSEKKMAAKETMNAREAGCSTLRTSRVSGLRHRTTAIAKKLIAVMAATTNGGNVEIALPTRTATAILAMNAKVIPMTMWAVRYRVARTPVV